MYKIPSPPLSLTDCEGFDTHKEIQVILLNEGFNFLQNHEAIPAQSIWYIPYISPRRASAF